MPPTKSREERGYGPDHQKARARWAPTVATGTTRCTNPNCLRPDDPLIHPDEPWDLGHDHQHQGPGVRYRGPEHRACNRSEGGRNGANITNGRRQITTRAWGDP